jgi:uncharacterized membrane protein
MGKHTPVDIRKSLPILLIVLFAVSVTVLIASAQPKGDFVVISKSKSLNSNAVTVQFNDESTGDPTSWNWKFGDGSTSTDNNPTHTYTDGLDTHKVTLKVSDDNGNTDTTSKVVDTTPQEAPTADFYADLC